MNPVITRTRYRMRDVKKSRTARRFIQRFKFRVNEHGVMWKRIHKNDSTRIVASTVASIDLTGPDRPGLFCVADLRVTMPGRSASNAQHGCRFLRGRLRVHAGSGIFTLSRTGCAFCATSHACAFFVQRMYRHDREHKRGAPQHPSGDRGMFGSPARIRALWHNRALPVPRAARRASGYFVRRGPPCARRRTPLP